MNLGWHIKPAQVFLRPRRVCFCIPGERTFVVLEDASLFSLRTRPCCPGEQSLVVGELILTFWIL